MEGNGLAETALTHRLIGKFWGEGIDRNSAFVHLLLKYCYLFIHIHLSIHFLYLSVDVFIFMHVFIHYTSTYKLHLFIYY